MRDNKEIVWSWSQYYADSFAFAKSLHYLGVGDKKSVNIMGFNSPELVIACFGTIFNSNVASGVYITNGPDACLYQAEHSEAQVIVVDSLAQLKIYSKIIDKLPNVKAVVCWGLEKLPDIYNKDYRFYTFKRFM